MGDGLLAIFPIVGDRAQTSSVCEAALAAAIEASSTVATRFGSSGDDRAEDVRFGLALHLGQVMYGNIGGGNSAGFYLHRAGREPRGSHREALQPTGTDDSGVR